MTCKVFFISPPPRHYIAANVARKIEAGREFRQKLGLLVVAAHLRTHGGVSPRIIDAPAEGLSPDGLEALLAHERPDVVGFSVLTFNLLDCMDVVKRVRRVSPGTRVCFGGYHPTLYPEETLGLDGVDFVVFGEGEVTFTELVAALLGPADFRDAALARIPGLGWTDANGDKRLNPSRPMLSRDALDAMPLPAHDLLDMSRYGVAMADASHVASLQTSRGCPGRCTFCDIRMTPYRYRSPESILAEIRMLKGLGVEELFIIDDTFTSNRNRVLKLCDALIAERVGMRFKISARVDMVDPEMLARLRAAGCYRIHFGVETGSQRLLDYMEKGVTLEQVARAFAMTHAAGIETFAYLMLGIPTETEDEIRQTLRFVDQLNPTHANYSVCTPFPKTKLYEQLLAASPGARDYWREFALNPQPDFAIPPNPGQLDPALLRDWQDRALRRFYMRPQRILREALRTRSLRQLSMKAAVGLRILVPDAAMRWITPGSPSKAE